MATCVECGKGRRPVCGDGFCAACHKSLSFSDCVDGTWNVDNLRRTGHSDEELRELYPDAKQWKGKQRSKG